jgi:hypothetical protein
VSDNPLSAVLMGAMLCLLLPVTFEGFRDLLRGRHSNMAWGAGVWFLPIVGYFVVCLFSGPLGWLQFGAAGLLLWSLARAGSTK